MDNLSSILPYRLLSITLALQTERSAVKRTNHDATSPVIIIIIIIITKLLLKKKA